MKYNTCFFRLLLIITSVTILACVYFHKMFNMQSSVKISENSMRTTLRTVNIADLQETHYPPNIFSVNISELYQPGFKKNCSKLCPNFGKNMTLVVLILSAPKNHKQRQAIRKSWGYYALRLDVVIAFIIGEVPQDVFDKESHQKGIREETLQEEVKQETPQENFEEKYLEQEENTYNDIIRTHILDTYLNLTLKTLSILEWTITFCPQVKFLLKSDDDVFINISNLLDLILALNPKHRSMYGYLTVWAEPDRLLSNKYYISQKDYNQPYYPPYFEGPAYLLPMSIVEDLYREALKEKYFIFEDVFYTGTLRKKLKIEDVDVQGFDVQSRREMYTKRNKRKFREMISRKVDEEKTLKLWRRQGRLVFF